MSYLLKDINSMAEPYVIVEEGVVSSIRATHLNDTNFVDTYSSCGVPFLRKYKYIPPDINFDCNKNEVPYKIKDVLRKKSK